MVFRKLPVQKTGRKGPGLVPGKDNRILYFISISRDIVYGCNLSIPLSPLRNRWNVAHCVIQGLTLRL